MKKLTCPNCNKKIAEKANDSYKPFCSEKCKLIDLACWFTEHYTIADKDTGLDNVDNDEKQYQKH